MISIHAWTIDAHSTRVVLSRVIIGRTRISGCWRTDICILAIAAIISTGCLVTQMFRSLVYYLVEERHVKLFFICTKL
jgi:hypothetical protein